MSGETLEAWVAIGHLHDGHRFYVWDTSKSPKVVVLGIDNASPDVFMSAYGSGEEVLEQLLLEAMIGTIRYRHPGPSAPLPPLSTAERLGCAAFVLAALALVWWWLA